MHAGRFISGKLRFKGRLATVAIAVSFLVMIIAVTVAAGFRQEIRKGISSICGDVQLTAPGREPMCSKPSYLTKMQEVDGVETITPAIYRTAIIKGREDIQGVVVKGIPADTSASMQARIPERLARILSIKEGDPMLTYFIEDKVKVRRFTVQSIYSDIVDADDRMIVYVPIQDMQRLLGWGPDDASCLEVMLDGRHGSDKDMAKAASELGYTSLAWAGDDEDTLVSTSVADKYPQIFDWLGLIDFNVVAILLLMTVVAGFNMISGLLILLFRNISTIGTLKSLGMKNMSIAGVFLRVASRIVLTGMAIGNGLALLFCLVEGKTHLLHLNPENYFVSFVPVKVDLPMILLADLAAYLVILLLMLIPSLFIARIDPAETVRVQ